VIKDYKNGSDMARMGQKRNTYRVLVRKPVRKRLPGRPRLRWNYNIKAYIGETKRELVN
jgi:hypothetical protein